MDMTQPAPSGDRLLWLRRLGMAVGVALLLGAIVMVIRQREVVADALAAIADPSPAMVALLVSAVVMNIVLSGIMFHILMSRYGRVGILEMQALIAATTLVNFLPLRPGLLGRMAYHKTVNNIAVADSARTIIQGAILSVFVAGYAACAALSAIMFDVSLWLMVLLPVPLLALAVYWKPTRRWSVAGTVRYAEVLVWAVRYYAAFALLDLAIDWQSALALACVSVIATMVPFVSNGLGLREWAVGLMSPMLTSYQLTVGLTAELINRAVEILVVLVLGLAAMGYLSTNRSAAAQRP
jgi:hypothetical protein